MLATIDLTRRQTARVLEQALRARTRVEIEFRSGAETICGSLFGREDALLCVTLHDLGGDWSLTGLIGAFCDVRIVLSGQLYLFSTCIVDLEDSLPQKLFLAVPELVQVANRRKFDRTALPELVEVQFWAAGAPEPLVGTVKHISLGGLDCRLPRNQVEDLVLIDDEVRVRFRLPGTTEFFDLAALVCVKTRSDDATQMHVGLEFCIPQAGAAAQASLQRLRARLTRDYTGPTQGEGGV